MNIRFGLIALLGICACNQARTRTAPSPRSTVRADANVNTSSSADANVSVDAGFFDGGAGFPPDGGETSNPDATAPSFVDLAVSVTTAPPASVTPGTVFDLILLVENLGQINSSATNLEVTISDGQGGPESNLGLSQVLPLMPREQRTFQFTLTSPATPGRYVIKAHVDRADSMSDSDRSNNLTPGQPMEVTTIIANPTTLDFGNLPTGCASDESIVTFTNQSPNPATLIGFRTNPTVSDFSLSMPGQAVEIMGNGSYDLGFVFSPTTPASARATGLLNFEQNSQTVSVELEFLGSSIAPMTHTEIFTQMGGTPTADFMFIIDNSCSMSQEQQSLASQFPTFIQNAQTAGLDFHIAITTTDVTSSGEQGQFISSTPAGVTVLTPTTPNLETTFAQMVNLGTSGSGIERGLEAARLALQSPNNVAGFLRAGATLVIIFISDEEDQSAQAVSSYLQAYQQGVSASGVLINAIVGEQPGGCAGPNGSADYGDRYIQTVNSTGGVVDSICGTNWTNALTNFGSNLGTTSSFTLQRSANPNSIVVEVAGQIVSPSNYTYQNGVVTFVRGSEPAAGSTITITYSRPC